MVENKIFLDTDTICLDKNFSTTRLVTKEKPAIEKRPEDKLETVLFLPEGKGRKGEGGLRTGGYFKKSYDNKPLISVVTVVYNGEKHLEQTIKSVLGQTYDNVEYIIIDGGSTDGTLDIIRKHEEQMDYWVSEPDRGIYDAMNKGIVLAKGEWINFMNAGDRFFDRQVFQNVYNNIDEEAGLLYGDTEMRYNTFVRDRKAISAKYIYKRMPFGHQSMFVRTKIHKDDLYDLEYTVCADYNFACTLYKKGVVFKKINSLLASCSTDGISDIQSSKRTQQAAKIAYRHFPRLSIKLIHQKKMIKNHIKNFFKRVLPSEMVENIKRLK